MKYLNKTIHLCYISFFLFLINLKAHTVSSANVKIEVDTKKNSYTSTVTMTVQKSKDSEINELISPEQAAEEFVSKYIFIFIDNVKQKTDNKNSLKSISDELTPETLKEYEAIVTMKGYFKENKKIMTLYNHYKCSKLIFLSVLKDNIKYGNFQTVLVGEYSRPIELSTILEEDPFKSDNRIKKYFIHRLINFFKNL